jgi:predicted ATPase
VISKRDLINQVWPDVHVEESSLRFHMNKLRKALGDGQAGARYLATFAGRGYCFVAPVSRKVPEVQLKEPESSDFSALPPPLIRMIGRAQVVQSLFEGILSDRFITIVGPGGIGKTTVAVSIGHRLSDRFAGRIHFLDLSPVRDSSLAIGAMGAMIGIRLQSTSPLQDIVDFLKPHKTLVILDSCEHVVGAASELCDALFRQAPGIHILATSRESLRAEGETVHRLRPLDSPPEDHSLGSKDALSFSAVQLFVERVQASGMEFQLTDANVQVVASICRKLDGMALAIELAAGRVSSYGLTETDRLLDSQLKLLWRGRRAAVPRHQTLTATLDWSYSLLGDLEKTLLARFSVFIGRVGLNAITEVCSGGDIDETDVVDLLAQLVEKSLICAETSGQATLYRMLDTTRDYAYRKLRESDEFDTLHRRHAVYFKAYLESHVESSDFAAPLGSSRILGDHLSNIRLSLSWSIGTEGDLKFGLIYIAQAIRAFMRHSLLSDCKTWSEKGLALLTDDMRGGELEMMFLAALGQSLMFTKGNSELVRSALLRSSSIADEIERSDYQLQNLGCLHLFHERIGDFRSSLDFAKRSRVVAEARANHADLAAADSFLGIAHHLEGNQSEAYGHLHAARQLALDDEDTEIQFGFDYRIRASIAMARCLWLQGRGDTSASLILRTIEEASRRAHPVTLCMALIWAASIFRWRGEYGRARYHVDALTEHAVLHSLTPYFAVADALRAELAIYCGRQAEGSTELRQCRITLHQDRYELLSPEFDCSLAKAHIETGDPSSALAILDAAIARAFSGAETFMLAEQLRLKGEALSMARPPNLDLAKATFEQALSTADRQGAPAFKLRAACSLAALLRSGRRRMEALETLESVYAGFSEGLDTLDLQSARRLIEDLRQ